MDQRRSITIKDGTRLLTTIFFALVYSSLSATEIPDSQLSVQSGRMLFTLVKKSSSGYDPSMTEYASMTGVANKVSGLINMTEKTFDVTMDMSLESVSLGGKFKFANNKMHETYLESFKFGSANYKGTIQSYNSANGKAKVIGDMTVHGITKENFAVSCLIEKSKSGKGYLFIADFKVNLNDFNIEVPNTKITKVSEIVTLRIKLELKKAKTNSKVNSKGELQ